MILQVTSGSVLLNYGPVGAFAVIMLGVIYAMGKYFVKQQEKSENRYIAELTALREQMNKYISEDRNKMLDVIEKNTIAFNKLTAEIHSSNNK